VLLLPASSSSSSSKSKEEYRSLLSERQGLEPNRRREYKTQVEEVLSEARGAKVRSHTKRKGANGTAVGRRRGGHSLGRGASLPGLEAVTADESAISSASTGRGPGNRKGERERTPERRTNRDKRLDCLGLFMRRQRRQDKDAADNVERAGEDRVSEFGWRGGELVGEGREREGEVMLEDVAGGGGIERVSLLTGEEQMGNGLRQ
jgi:hypothetical protein